MISRSRMQVGTWSRRIGGGVLVLALAGLAAPAPTSARFGQDETPIEVPGEDIYVFGKAPQAPSPAPPTISSFDTGTHTGAGAPNAAPSGGGSTSGGGLFDGYGYVPSVPSAGGSGSVHTAEFRLKNAENQCTSAGGTWREEAFDDFGDENLVHIGYLCISKVAVTSNPPFNGYREWRYYDSDGFMNYMCYGDSEVRICAKNVP